METWTKRPSLYDDFAPADGDAGCEPNMAKTMLTAKQLLDHFLADGERASNSAPSDRCGEESTRSVANKPKWLPPRSSNNNTTREKEGKHNGPMKAALRCAQWNLHYFEAPFPIDDKMYIECLIRELTEVDADFMILNEFGNHQCSSRVGCTRNCEAARTLIAALEECGYHVLVGEGESPTAIASRLPTSCSWSYEEGRFVHCTVHVPTIKQEQFAEAHNMEDSFSSSIPLALCGVHLSYVDDGNGVARLKQVQNLLEKMPSALELTKNEIKNDFVSSTVNLSGIEADVAGGSDGKDPQSEGCQVPILVVGDMNQQRSTDYYKHEWEFIRQNKSRRGSPEDDGVDREFRSNGFTCSLDQEPKRTNWIKGAPPPATHWTSTTIDFSYQKGNMSLEGIYVSPSNLSDHRMVVCDWMVIFERLTQMVE